MVKVTTQEILNMMAQLERMVEKTKDWDYHKYFVKQRDDFLKHKWKY
jgi:hypothetical protein